jgi:predicted nucleic acid-binding protein
MSSTFRNIAVMYARTIVAMSDLTHVLVRVWLPDRPGALGLVASRIGAVEGDIVGIDVLEQGDNVAVDEFAVALRDPRALDLLIREIEEVDGASVEEVRVVEHFPDPRLDALESAMRLCSATTVTELHETLVAEICAEFLADWTALLGAANLLASTGAAVPDVCVLEALVAGTAASPMVADGTTGPDDLAVAAVATHEATLLVGRDGHPFRRRERAQLVALAGIADRAWAMLDR